RTSAIRASSEGHVALPCYLSLPSLAKKSRIAS
ncbi:MAG: hypothetical protein ACJAZN_002764, partial [Planctomycetota bacterium]